MIRLARLEEVAVFGFVTVDLLLQENILTVRPSCAQEATDVQRMGLLPL